MKIIDQSWRWIQKPVLPLEIIELAGRTCYKSEDNITPDSAKNFIQMILKRGHESVIEHVSASVKFITNRGVTHELVRHRLCAFSQESTRYVNYNGHGIEFIKPVWCNDSITGLYENAVFPNADDLEWEWLMAIKKSEDSYNLLVEFGWRPEQAREVLPNSLKTEIVVTANLREWRHIFKLRTSKAAHPQIRELMLGCLKGFKAEIPVVFNDIA